MYIAHNKVRMHDTDMAGRLYFARQFRFANDTLEDFTASIGYVFHEASFVFVIVHCEADYFSLLKVGDPLTIHLTVEKVGTTSFTLFYQIFRGEELVGTAKTTHVTLDFGTGLKIPIPEYFKATLLKYNN